MVVDGATPELAEAGAARLTERLKAMPELLHDVHRPDGGPFFDHHGLMLLPLEEVQAATEKLIESQPFLGPWPPTPACAA
ncbi:hypothetical protein ACFQU7_19235 [Pseudoroseomonas wenyumeiae]